MPSLVPRLFEEVDSRAASAIPFFACRALFRFLKTPYSIGKTPAAEELRDLVQIRRQPLCRRPSRLCLPALPVAWPASDAGASALVLKAWAVAIHGRPPVSLSRILYLNPPLTSITDDSDNKILENRNNDDVPKRLGVIFLMNDKAPVSHPRNQVAVVTGVHRELPLGELLCFAGVEETKMKESPLKPNDVEA